jgi:hypothetical protein
MQIVWIVVKQIGPALFEELSTFLTGRGCFKVRRVNACHLAKVVLMIIPSAPLSSKAEALISREEDFPTRDTLRVIEGDRIL